MSKFVTSIKSQDLTLVSLMNVWNLTIVFVDPLFEAIRHGTAGAVIAAVLARVPKSAMA